MSSSSDGAVRVGGGLVVGPGLLVTLLRPDPVLAQPGIVANVCTTALGGCVLPPGSGRA